MSPKTADQEQQVSPPAPPSAGDAVLSTLNQDGSRRWLNPRLSLGRFLNRRRAIGIALIVLFTTIPFLRIAGKPVLLFDLPNRRFTFFGVEFLPTETLLLALLILSIFVGIFLLTALFGRVWCGYACPQTVYMELVFRPIERLFGGPEAWKKPAKYLIFLLVSLYLANTFLAYFVGTDTLLDWVTGRPSDHIGAFLVMAAVTALMMIDFAYAREQVCTLMCPYGRFQSVMLDRHSLIIGYDQGRGEPRGPLRKSRNADETVKHRGDCVDCKLCVRTCPTGIDIRNGLQMECIGCAQCIDACDAVMDKIGRDRGLIRYSSQEALESKKRRLLRPRVVIYPAILVVVLTGLIYALGQRGSVDLTFLRVRSTPYQVQADGHVANRVSMKLTNKSSASRVYALSLVGVGSLTASDGTITVPPGESHIKEVTVILPSDRFLRGRANITLKVMDDLGEQSLFQHHVLGPLFPTHADSTGGSTEPSSHPDSEANR